MSTVSRSGLAVQSPTPPDCRHSRQPFDASFAVIAERDDLGPGPKLLYAKLVTLHRTGASWTQDRLAASLGTCRQNVWRWTRELVAAGLLLVVRLGQGRPNAYTLLGVPRDDLDGAAPKGRPGAGHQEVRTPGQDRRPSFNQKKPTKEWGYRPPATGGFLQTREGHYHDVIGRR